MVVRGEPGGGEERGPAAGEASANAQRGRGEEPRPTSRAQEPRERERRGVQPRRTVTGWRVAAWAFVALALAVLVWWLVG